MVIQLLPGPSQNPERQDVARVISAVGLTSQECNLREVWCNLLGKARFQGGKSWKSTGTEIKRDDRGTWFPVFFLKSLKLGIHRLLRIRLLKFRCYLTAVFSFFGVVVFPMMEIITPNRQAIHGHPFVGAGCTGVLGACTSLDEGIAGSHQGSWEPKPTDQHASNQSFPPNGLALPQKPWWV